MTRISSLDDRRSSALAVLGALAGSWKGHGHGDFPTMDPFDYDEEIVFSPLDERAIGYQQHAYAAGDGETLHYENGVWRVTADGRLEVTVAMPGVAEVSEGSAARGTIRLMSTSMRRATAGAALVVAERTYQLDGDTLRYDIRMGTVPVPVHPHIRAVLSRQ